MPIILAFNSLDDECQYVMSSSKVSGHLRFRPHLFCWYKSAQWYFLTWCDIVPWPSWPFFLSRPNAIERSYTLSVASKCGNLFSHPTIFPSNLLPHSPSSWTTGHFLRFIASFTSSVILWQLKPNISFFLCVHLALYIYIIYCW